MEIDQDIALSSQPNYQRIEAALYYLANNQQESPSLRELAALCGLSEFHFQKTFTRWVGISPKRFSQFLNKEYIKALLDDGIQPLQAAYQAGLSGPGRLHDLFIQSEAMSPAQYKALGKGLTIHYGFHDSPFGEYLLAITQKGICQLEFINKDKQESLSSLQNNWKHSTLLHDEALTAPIHAKIFEHNQDQQIKLLLKGTNFQIQVWQALLKIPYGCVSHYEDLARLSGNQTAIRASASAIARNKIAWLIPCHRVVRKIGESGQYRWGTERKKVILGFEGSTRQAANPQ